MMQKSISYEGVDLVIGSLGSVPDKFEAVPLCRKEHLLVVPKETMSALSGDRLDELVEKFSQNADLSFFEAAPFIKIPRQSSVPRARLPPRPVVAAALRTGRSPLVATCPHGRP